MTYFSLALRVPEATAVDPRVLAWYYGMLTRVPFGRAVHRRFLTGALAQAVTQGRGLDLGTGPGYVALAIARHQPNLQMVGLDLAAHMVKQARRQAARAKLDGNGMWPQADGHRLPFRDNSFSLVVSSFALHHWDDPLLILNEIARVLAPEGRYYITDLCRDVSLLQRLVAYASIPPISLPFGSYRGYGGYYESVRAGYTRAEAQDLVDQSALPSGEVVVESTCCVPILTIACKSSSRLPVGRHSEESNLPDQSDVQTDSERERASARFREMTEPAHS